MIMSILLTTTLLMTIMTVGCAILFTRSLLQAEKEAAAQQADIQIKRERIRRALRVCKAIQDDNLIKEGAILWGIDDNNHSVDILDLVDSVKHLKDHCGAYIIDRIVHRARNANRSTGGKVIRRLADSHYVSHLVDALKLIDILDYNVFSKHINGGDLNDGEARI